MLLSASKEADKIKLKEIIDESFSNWDLISKNDRSLVIRMILKWWPLEGKIIDAAKVVLEKNPALDTITAKKIVAVGVANLGIQELSELISILEKRFEFDAQMLQKLSRRRDLLLRKTQRL